MTETERIARRLDEVRARIERAGRDPGTVRIVGVTKGHGPGAVTAALAAGLTEIGESYAQELEAKRSVLGELAAGARWHFVGRLQRNKVAALAGVVALWHSVDRQAIVDELARRAPGSSVLVQVNVSGEPQKAGCAPGDAPALVDAARGAGLAVLGLMGVGPIGAPEDARPSFRRLRRLVDDLGLAHCSMGMSRDFEVALQEGADVLRLGEVLFGPRPPRGPG